MSKGQETQLHPATTSYPRRVQGAGEGRGGRGKVSSPLHLPSPCWPAPRGLPAVNRRHRARWALVRLGEPSGDFESEFLEGNPFGSGRMIGAIPALALTPDLWRRDGGGCWIKGPYIRLDLDCLPHPAPVHEV